ncbi:MAG: DUF1080 domain-containing protein [Bacteroidetes bacterium]|nr:DUF1080 domain-containing protein [Bacteroidota bacterium]
MKLSTRSFPVMRKSLFFILGIFYFHLGFAQPIPFDDPQWEINAEGSLLEDFQGKPSLYLRNGQAYLKDFEFTNGIIEFDLYITPRRGFPGVMFRWQDQDNFEEFYMRPHQTGNPDANQYTPVFNKLAGWQLYYGGAYSKAYRYKMDQWTHVKLVVSGTRAEVYIDDMEKPLLHIPELKRPLQAGSVGLKSFISPMHFANFTIQKIDDPPLIGQNQIPETLVGTIKDYQISNAFNEMQLEERYTLDEEFKKQFQWTEASVEARGLLNLARYVVWNRETNTVFARVVVNSVRDQIKKLSISFSDRAKVYCNGQILYSGHDEFRSRDYRFLGTMGYYDDVYLPLNQGDNEVWLAISENFGGWALMAMFDNMDGISLK